MQIEIVKGASRGERMVMVDGKQWGEFEMAGHGPRGNSFTLRQCYGTTVYMDDKEKKSVKVYGDKMTHRFDYGAPWQVEGTTVEQRLLAAAQFAVEKKRLIDPDEVRAKNVASNLAWRRELDAQREEARVRDVQVGMQIMEKFFPGSGVDAMARMKVAEAIADAIEKGRSE